MSQIQSVISTYLSDIQKVLSTGDAREHAYRPAFQNLIETISTDIRAINEPAYTGANAPDFLFKKGETPIAYAECKDVSVNIFDINVQKQAQRYVTAFGRILLTNYYDFEIINETGEPITISIARIENNIITPLPQNFEKFANLIVDYLLPSHRTIGSAKKLAQIMASKARLLHDNALASLQENHESDIFAQYTAFKQVLINDLSEEDFADMYAQTLVYGLFVARYHDATMDSFSRHEAQDILPSSNPLLKKFFGHVAGTDFDPKIAWLVDSLIEAYLSADVAGLMHKEFTTKKKDPVLHFYETFLTEYDKDLRKNRGVYYTPEPVVSFIVRSVDQILRDKFDLPKGLADTHMIEYKTKVQGSDGRTKDGIKQTVKKIHKVQILDPAVGTGTFLNEVIHEIHKSFKGQEGIFPQYVREHLLPRLHGFELMMASYTMAHLKLGVTLKEYGYEGNERLSVWLTNSLEESAHEVPNLFMSQWLTEESNMASKIKSDMPIMVVMGNPPYSVSSANKGESIQKLIKVYKENLDEKNIQPLSDDYIKFIRFAENQVEKTGYGIVAMITNNSFLDGVIHKQMRKHLMKVFDEIYVLDLHGNAKKKETAPSGSKDENVFDIQQGVSINLFVKKGEKKPLANVYHAEIFGSRKEKYAFLNDKLLQNIEWKKIKNIEPYSFFIPMNMDEKSHYDEGFGVQDLFKESTSGIKTHRDNLVIAPTETELQKKITIFFSDNSDTGVISRLNLKETKTWTVTKAKQNNHFDSNKIKDILYRPFDVEKIYYDSKLIDRGREKILSSFFKGANLSLLTCRQQSTFDFQHVFISDQISDMCAVSLQSKETGYIFMLYVYNEDGAKKPNLDEEIIEKFGQGIGLSFCHSCECGNPEFLDMLENCTCFTPEDVLDYIYAVLHSPSYREKYKEFLKIDFPRVPYPTDKDNFWQLVACGRELRALHLLDESHVGELVTTFPMGGTNTVDKKCPKYEDAKVYINDTQYFDGISEIAWNFYIGGYQPAQKWLKDRRERTLSIDDIMHYQKMIVALTKTDEIMKKIDEIFEA